MPTLKLMTLFLDVTYKLIFKCSNYPSTFCMRGPFRCIGV